MTSEYLRQTEGLVENSKPIYEVCDSKCEKSAPWVYLKGDPFTFSVFAWIMGFKNLAYEPWKGC